MKHTKLTLLSTLLLTAGLLACQPKPEHSSTAEVMSLASITDFAAQPSSVKYIADFVELDFGKHGVGVTFLAQDNPDPAFTITPPTSWQWQELGDFRVAVDIANNTDIATHLFVQIGNEQGQVHNRSVNVPASSKNTYHIELKGIDLEIESGIRSNPLGWESTETPFIWRWGLKNIELNAVNRIKFSVSNLLKDRHLDFSNMRLLKNPPRSTAYLEKLSDEYGQRIGSDSPYHISSNQELNAVSQQELMGLDNKLMADRSTFGGWANGPKFEGTGYFRTQKVDGKWSLVDPEGYLFFSTGIANVRMANTSTITGIDFDANAIKKRTSDDLTPEDSLGLNPVPTDALKTAFVASELRRNMFTWLPSYDEPLAKHYGYRRSVHQGALKHGETFSFYQANLERKFGDDYIETWKDITVKRMRNWGFTSFGNWIDPMFYHDNQVPYFANGWIIGDFKTVSSGNDLWSRLPDPFDPKFTERARATLEQIALEVKKNPWCVGVFIDNEKSWGNKSSVEGQYGVVINTLARADKESPTKAIFSQLMRDKYTNIEALNAAWNSDLSSWDELANGVEITDLTDGQLADFSIMLKAYASEYFRIVKTELKRVLPNHMYMGVRFASWGFTPEIVEAAAEHVDVMSYNIYKEGVHANYWKFLEQVDMPSIIGEFHMGAMDTGLINPGLVHAATQSDRAEQYVNYMTSVASNPYFVGAHWFQYIDSPLTGRAYDGENYNVGFVSVTDTPYQPMIDAVKAFNRDLYPRRYGVSEE